MPLTFLTQLRDTMFLSELQSLSFRDSSPEFADSYQFAVSDGYSVRYANTYTPGPDGVVTVYSLDKIIDQLMDDSYCMQVVIMANRTSRYVTVIRCSVSVPVDAVTYTAKRFLTAVQTERDTACGRIEMLTAHAPERPAVTVTATYADPATGLLTYRTYHHAAAEWPQILVRPSAYSSGGIGQLVALCVRCGSRLAKYRVLAYAPAAEPAFVFVNSFGCLETVYLTGTLEHQPRYDRSQVMAGGSLVTYDIDEEDLCLAHTGKLRESGVALLRDLLRSRQVWLLNPDGSRGDAVTVTDCKAVHRNDSSDLPEFTVTYRRSSRISAQISVSPDIRHSGVFDHTFDHTYE